MGYQWAVIGAGLAGSTIAEQIASELRETVLVVDRRTHIAGNTYDEIDDIGVLIHRYGPHIFHTNSDAVWKYLSKFTEWRKYEHRVLASVDDMLVPVPFNFQSIDLTFPRFEADVLKAKLAEFCYPSASTPVMKLLGAADEDLRRLASFVYRKVFLGYTTKQWGLPPEQLDPSVTARVPLRASYDDRYFQDTHQGLPQQGYTHMVSRMLDSDLIKVRLGVQVNMLNAMEFAPKVVYTGPIDEFFGYRFGRLPYRSLKFRYNHVLIAEQPVQKVGTINFPNDGIYTRATEFRHLTGQVHGSSTVVKELPAPDGDPYYPVPRKENEELYQRYRKLALSFPNVVFVGRLAQYRYYNMDQVVAAALRVFDSHIRPTA